MNRSAISEKACFFTFSEYPGLFCKGVIRMYEYLQIGKIVNTHGVRGEVRLIPLTDDPHRFDELEWVYVETDDTNSATLPNKKYTIENLKYAKGSVIIKFSGIDTVETANTLRDCFVMVDRSHAVKLPKDSFFICDILGSTVSDEKGEVLGQLTDVLQTGSNDVYVVKDESGRELLLPALKSVVRKVSPERRRIEVIVPKGLLDDEV